MVDISDDDDFEVCQLIDGIAGGDFSASKGIRDLLAMGLSVGLIERLDFSAEGLNRRCLEDMRGDFPSRCRSI